LTETERGCIGGGGPPLMRSAELADDARTGLCPICSRRLRLDAQGLLPEHDVPEHDIDHGNY